MGSNKCHLRGACTYSSLFLNKSRYEKIENIVSEIALLESQQKSNYFEDKQKSLSSAKLVYRSLTTAQAKFLHLKTRQKHYEFAEQPSKLLALKLKRSEHLASIDSFKD